MTGISTNQKLALLSAGNNGIEVLTFDTEKERAEYAIRKTWREFKSDHLISLWLRTLADELINQEEHNDG